MLYVWESLGQPWPKFLQKLLMSGTGNFVSWAWTLRGIFRPDEKSSLKQNVYIYRIIIYKMYYKFF